MADFTIWGCAVAEAIGYSQKEFLDMYELNRDSQNTQVLDAHPEVNLITSFMQDKDVWTGTAQELLEHLRQLTSFSWNKGEKDIGLPKNANAFGRRLNLLQITLEELGVHMKRYYQNKQRIITLTKVGESVVDVVGVAESSSTADSVS
jgi:hypothetical protein